MKFLKNTLATVLILMVSVIAFFTFNLITGIVSNYQSFTINEISSFPMILFFCELVMMMVVAFDCVVLKRRDPYLFRKYSIIIGCFSLVGAASSIIDGTLVYGTFFGDYVFFAYPFIMLVFHLLLLGVSVYMAIITIRAIIKDKPEKTYKPTKLYWLRELLVCFMLVFALERLGGFLLLPVYWSSYDSIYVLPYYIQLIVPAVIFVGYMIDRYWLHSAKVSIILFSSTLAYSIFSLIYIVMMSKGTAPLTVNPLSTVLQLERLVTKPYGTIILFGFSILASCGFLTLSVIKLIKSKSSK